MNFLYFLILGDSLNYKKLVCIGALWGALSFSIVAASQLNIIKLPYLEPQILVGLPVLPGILGFIIMLILFQQRIELHNESIYWFLFSVFSVVIGIVFVVAIGGIWQLLNRLRR